MIDKVLIIGAPPPGCVERLKRAGVNVLHVPTATAVAAAVQESNFQLVNVLVLGGQLPGTHSWGHIARQAEQPSCESIMQAIVQHNRCSLLDRAAPSIADTTSAAATLTEPAGEPTFGQQRHLQELPRPPALLVVGYVMKSSREEQLASAKLLHLLPVDGVCFMPFDVGHLGTAEQQSHIDVLLHKGSDELVPAAGGGVMWSQRVTDLQAWLASKPHICVVDPFPSTAKVLDRVILGQLMDQLQHLQLPGGVAARAPRYCRVDSFEAAGLQEKLALTGMAAPFIVKPVVACGVKHSHCMALVLQAAALQQLQGQLPLPAIVQEFVNHGSMQWKVYVLGDQVFLTPRASIPDVHSTPDLPPEQQLLLFDSLASLPTQLPPHIAQPASTGTSAPNSQQQQQPDQAAVEAIAAYLRGQLGLTLFGFDVVAAHKSCSSSSSNRPAAASHQELVVIDINYFPNYRGGSNTPALFRQALVQCWQQHTAALQAHGKGA